MQFLQPEDTALSQETISPEMLEFAITASKQLAKRTQHRPEFVDLDDEDIEQELLLYVLERAEQFDPEKANHEAFVNRMLKTGLGTMIRNANRKKSRPPIGVAIQSITTSVEQPQGPPEMLFRLLQSADKDRRTRGVSRIAVEEYDLVEAVDFQIKTLPNGYRRIARQMMKTKRRKTAEQLGISKRKLAEAMKVITEHFASADWLKP
jgi:DNA-directed RNA polymerase specialized sigma24 family protein